MEKQVDWRAGVEKFCTDGGLEYIAKGIRSGGWPMDKDGNLIKWSDFIISKIEEAVAMIAEREKRDG